MVEEPDELLPLWVEAGCELLIVHAEACRHLHRTLGRIRDLGRPGGGGAQPGDAAGGRRARPRPVRPGAGDDRESRLRRPVLHRDHGAEGRHDPPLDRRTRASTVTSRSTAGSARPPSQARPRRAPTCWSPAPRSSRTRPGSPTPSTNSAGSPRQPGRAEPWFVRSGPAGRALFRWRSLVSAAACGDESGDPEAFCAAVAKRDGFEKIFDGLDPTDVEGARATFEAALAVERSLRGDAPAAVRTDIDVLIRFFAGPRRRPGHRGAAGRHRRGGPTRRSTTSYGPGSTRSRRPAAASTCT